MPHGAFWISIPEGFAAAKSGMDTDRKASFVYVTVTILFAAGKRKSITDTRKANTTDFENSWGLNFP